jgi:pimeloyl-ACP methyl ester carboxylesterase
MLDLSTSTRDAVIRGLPTAWIEAGEAGKPIVFLCHGFPDSPEVWSSQIQCLAPDYHVIAPYVRGCDRSVPASNLRRYGRDAVLLDHLEILRQVSSGEEPVICVGHDLGVVHAMTLARSLGDRCAGLFCINGMDLEMFARRLRQPGQVARSWYMGFMQLPMIPELMARYIPHTSLTLASKLAGGPSPDVADSLRFRERAEATLNQYRAFVREIVSTGEPVKRLACPVMVVWGRDDGVLLAPTEEEWRIVCHKPTIRIIPGGHWLHRDEAKVIDGFISTFAQDCARQKSGDYHA